MNDIRKKEVRDLIGSYMKVRYDTSTNAMKIRCR